ncbi:hypothetical protein HG530_006395 [Fusarium avenaceum]|nr:hypothetical protein HG530_006395 [Fusarium avenaceum]
MWYPSRLHLTSVVPILASLIVECQAEEDWRTSLTLIFLFSDAFPELSIGEGVVTLQDTDLNMRLRELLERQDRVLGSGAPGGPSAEGCIEELVPACNSDWVSSTGGALQGFKDQGKTLFFCKDELMVTVGSAMGLSSVDNISVTSNVL